MIKIFKLSLFKQSTECLFEYLQTITNLRDNFIASYHNKYTILNSKNKKGIST